MSHLTDETLALLVDEVADPAQALHLAECRICATELEALRAQTAALAGLPDLTPPARILDRVRTELALEGVVPDGRRPGRMAWRIAASLALLAGGGVGGFFARDLTTPGASAPASFAQAEQQLQEAEAAYNAALASYAAFGGSLPAADPVNRLAALEGIVLTTRAALDEAPADPVINGYHLTALVQRDAILRQIGTQSPTSNASEEWY